MIIYKNKQDAGIAGIEPVWIIPLDESLGPTVVNQCQGQVYVILQGANESEVPHTITLEMTEKEAEELVVKLVRKIGLPDKIRFDFD